MQWTVLTRHLDLDESQQKAIIAIVLELQRTFLRFCLERQNESQESVLDRLARFMAQKLDAAPDVLRAHFLHLLAEQSSLHSPRSLLDECQEAERTARAHVGSLLNHPQTILFTYAFLPSLLDIEAGEDAFNKELIERVAALAGKRESAGFFCNIPFEYAHVQANGDVYPCCPSKFAKVLGNLTETSLGEVWRSDAARDVRLSILDGSYRFCNHEACEHLRDAALRQVPLSDPASVISATARGMAVEGGSPRTINFAFDRSCNLGCDYCRVSRFIPNPTELERIASVHENIFNSDLATLERIILLGEGDPFASPFYREKLCDFDWSRYPRIQIKIQTNGLLLTPAMWDKMERNKSPIDWITVSVDAASEATYQLNRGGSFSVLLENLWFISRLRATGKIKCFYINFVVQANNFEEMVPFARLGEQLGCDLIDFQRIENWGTYTSDAFEKLAVHESWHPRYNDFLAVIKSPELRRPTVSLTKFSEFVSGTASVDRGPTLATYEAVV